MKSFSGWMQTSIHFQLKDKITQSLNKGRVHVGLGLFWAVWAQLKCKKMYLWFTDAGLLTFNLWLKRKQKTQAKNKNCFYCLVFLKDEPPLVQSCRSVVPESTSQWGQAHSTVSFSFLIHLAAYDKESRRRKYQLQNLKCAPLLHLNKKP